MNVLDLTSGAQSLDRHIDFGHPSLLALEQQPTLLAGADTLTADTVVQQQLCRPVVVPILEFRRPASIRVSERSVLRSRLGSYAAIVLEPVGRYPSVD